MNVDDDAETGVEASGETSGGSESWIAEQIWLITLEEGAST